MKKCCKNTALLFAVTLACAAAPVLAVSTQPQAAPVTSIAQSNETTVSLLHPENSLVFFQDARGKNHKMRLYDFAKAYYKLTPAEKNTMIVIRGHDARGRLHRIQGRLLDVMKDREAVDFKVAQAPADGNRAKSVILKRAQVALGSMASVAEPARPVCYTSVIPECETAAQTTMLQPHSSASNRLSLRRRLAESQLRQACEIASPVTSINK